jgi:uncharacterized membrane protein YuzA (DUF378 family)
MKMNALDWVAWVLVLVGGLNWGLVGFFDWNLVNAVLGSWSSVERVVYALVGLAALYIIVMMAMKGSKKEVKDAASSQM